MCIQSSAFLLFASIVDFNQYFLFSSYLVFIFQKSDKDAYFWDENITDFTNLGLSEGLIESLKRQGIERPTKVQVYF